MIPASFDKLLSEYFEIQAVSSSIEGGLLKLQNRHHHDFTVYWIKICKSESFRIHEVLGSNKVR